MKYITEFNFTYFFLLFENVANKKYEIKYVAVIIFLLDRANKNGSLKTTIQFLGRQFHLLFKKLKIVLFL